VKQAIYLGTTTDGYEHFVCFEEDSMSSGGEHLRYPTRDFQVEPDEHRY